MPTKPNLNKLLTKWQRKLRLQDWDIDIRWVTAKEMPEDVGRNTYNPANGVSSIEIKQDKDINDPHPLYHNTELTVVHELLHLTFGAAANWRREDDTRGLENSIEKVAKALLEL